ncbi:MAG TPA: hypothetical protein VNG89_14975 [Vicinamibacterales bacterium]|nr:hypothetical protein [Vicinamibacterales bacterium]
MRRRRAGVLLLVWAVAAAGLRGDAPPKRRLLGPNEREAVLALLKAVDLAQQTDVVADAGMGWAGHVLKSPDNLAYVPFRVTLGHPAELKSAAMYVRAVSRHDGIRSAQERSFLRDWLLHGNDIMPRNGETVPIGPGEIPVGGPGVSSSRPSTAAAAQASAALALREREYERQRRAAEEEKKRAESRTPDPFLFPFEEYYFFDAKSGAVERALALPPGDYDLYIGVIDKARVKTSSASVFHRTLTVPDLSEQLALSSVILAKDIHHLSSPLPRQQQAEHPYTFGQAEVVPVADASFTRDDVLTVVYQILNYGAPDADLVADYSFFRTDGGRVLFNRTNSQQLGDTDLPKPGTWDTAAFATQAVPLRPFPPGAYELEVTVRDRLTRASAKTSVAFSVRSEVR